MISIETLTMRVLITVPTKSGYGGVTNYYLGIKEYWKENIEYFISVVSLGVIYFIHFNYPFYNPIDLL